MTMIIRWRWCNDPGDFSSALMFLSSIEQQLSSCWDGDSVRAKWAKSGRGLLCPFPWRQLQGSPLKSSLNVNIKQVAQLSQRDCATHELLQFAKWRSGIF